MSWSIVSYVCFALTFISTFSSINCRIQDSNKFNDPKWNKQYYLNRYYEPTLDILPVWKNKITGRGIVVALIDEGFDFTNKEIADNFEPRASYDVFLEKDLRVTTSYNNHGTKCAGVIAAKANNRRCGVGIAFEAKIGGIRLLNNLDYNDTKEGIAFVYGLDVVDVYSNSWGPLDNGYHVRGLGPMAQRSLREGAEKGRNNRGSIYVFSAGNGGIWGDSCAFNGYVNSIYTIAVGYLRRNNMIPRNTEPCAAVIATAFGEDVVTCSSETRVACVENFGHTSASAALASGMVALALQANGNLSWRDVQHLIIRSSIPESITLDKGERWITNGANLKVHSRVGFGLMNAELLVNYAKRWSNVPRQEICSIDLPNYITFGVKKTLKLYNTPCNIKYIEHVTITLDLLYTRRGVLAMDLTSPDGTKSRMLYSRSLDTYTAARNYNNLTITSLQFWGENSEGTWTISLFNSNLYYPRTTGTLNSLSFTVYGTNKDPLVNNQHVLKSKLSRCLQLRQASSSVGSFKPKCKSDGQFESIQCFNAQCWCVDKYGKEISGTRQNGRSPDCSKQTGQTGQTGTSALCSFGNFYSDTFVCCNKKKYSRKIAYCGSGRQNCFQFCCNNLLLKTWSIKDRCCGKGTYSPSTHDCCNGQAIHKYSAWYWYYCS